MKEKELVCNEFCIHNQKIDNVKMPNKDEVEILAEMFKLFGDNTRLRIICAILNTELCVCDLCELLDLNQSTVSHQLQLLRNSKLVKYRKEGKQVYYSLKDEHIDCIIRMALAHILEKEAKGYGM